eukprot:Tamp_12850.p1 GENE.Tamp_12850~~Tamp_12850.p1  ORF type:complete len:566 (+),score=84.82 Tamp_12850:26-1699(+)
MPAANGGGERGAEGGTEMVESGAARTGKEPDEVGVVRAGEEAGASLLKNTESAEGEKEGDDAAPSTNSTADVSVSVSPQEAEAAASLQLRQSLCYIGTFIAAGLMVGTCGPALPTLFKRINEGGNTPLATPTPPPWPPRRSGGGTGGEASLASAFALRAFGGLGGSILGGWLLMRVVPKGGHLILAGGLVVAAVCPVILCYATEASHVALAFILLDFGCGTSQVGNTMMVWVQSTKATQWLNILNGSFGIGTLVSPALVAFLDLLLGSTSEAVEMALLIVSFVVLLIALFCMNVPSPTGPDDKGQDEQDKSSPGGVEEGAGGVEEGARGDSGQESSSSEAKDETEGSGAAAAGKAVRVKIAAGTWEWGTAVALTVLALCCAVGAETTFGTFLVAYVETQRHASFLDVSEVRADLITSFFWTSFTIGRFGAIFLERMYPSDPFCIMAVQIFVLQLGWMAILGDPSSEAALWLAALLVGGGVGGLFAGFIGQLSNRVDFTSFVGGCMGFGAMSGVALWNTSAAILGAHETMRVVATASVITALAQAGLVSLFRSHAAKA